MPNKIEEKPAEALEKDGVLTCAGAVARCGSKLPAAKDAVLAYWADSVDVAIKAATDAAGAVADHIIVPLSLGAEYNAHLMALVESLGFKGYVGADEEGGRILTISGWVGRA